jgi:hypothetical protein
VTVFVASTPVFEEDSKGVLQAQKMIPDENYFSIKKSLKILNVWKNKIL